MILLVTSALAATPTVQLQFRSAAPACVQATLERAIAERLGYSPFVESSQLRASVVIGERSGQLEARLTIQRRPGPESTRVLVGASDCVALHEALALSLSLAIDPLTFSRPRPASTEPNIEPPTQMGPLPPPEPRAEPASPEPSPLPAKPPLSVSLGATVGVDSGQHPTVRPTLALFGTLGGRSLRGLLEGFALMPSRLEVGPGSTELFSIGATAGFCGHLSVAYGCAVVRAAGLRFEGRDLAEASTGWLPSVGAGARIGLVWPEASTFAITAHVEARVALLRPRLFAGTALVFEQPFVQGNALAGVLVRLP